MLSAALDVEQERYRILLLYNASVWRNLGQSSAGWLGWTSMVAASQCEGVYRKAIKRCKRDLPGIALIVWGLS